MTGPSWDGTENVWVHAPQHYDAVHFHEDDVADVEWGPSVVLDLPPTLPSAVYSLKLTQSDPATGAVHTDHVPFFVRPRGGEPTNRLCFLIPTASYQAYENNIIYSQEIGELISSVKAATMDACDCFTHSNGTRFGTSTYDWHKDGSGVCYSSNLRPQLKMKPGPGAWQFTADCHVAGFLAARGIGYDVLTDHDLHREGADCLEGYAAVITGTHPEYYSTPMLDAICEYTQERGGRLAYVGANGFYWHVAYPEPGAGPGPGATGPEDDEDEEDEEGGSGGAPPTDLGGVMEMRRAEGGMRFWIAQHSEYHSSFNGELCGLWKYRGRGPHSTCGVGFSAQGFDSSIGFRRLPDSDNPWHRCRIHTEGRGGESKNPEMVAYLRQQGLRFMRWVV